MNNYLACIAVIAWGKEAWDVRKNQKFPVWGGWGNKCPFVCKLIILYNGAVKNADCGLTADYCF